MQDNHDMPIHKQMDKYIGVHLHSGTLGRKEIKDL